MSTGPPRLAVWILAALLPRTLRDEALQELADLHASRAARSDRRTADRRYWRALPRMLLRLRLAALGGELRPRDPRKPPPRREALTMTTWLTDLRDD